MKIETSKASGLALDWALAYALKRKPHVKRRHIEATSQSKRIVFTHTSSALIVSQIKNLASNGGVFQLTQNPETGNYACIADEILMSGATLHEAVARCVVALHCGGKVNVPDELAQGGQP